ncbi:MAG: DUF1294 domain-containing protein [Novosphingobium sp.]|nr:DUF1294 domain-containing protein [Novosphingobium sp.]
MALSAVNIWTVLSFWYDKQAAIRGDRRVSETNLLGLALIGGTPGAFLARKRFRHKTRKQPFSACLYLIAAVQIGGIAGWLLSSS